MFPDSLQTASQKPAEQVKIMTLTSYFYAKKVWLCRKLGVYLINNKKEI